MKLENRSKYQVATMHQLLSQLSMIQKSKILQCYKKDLGFTTQNKKREAEIRNQQNQGRNLMNEPFNVFLSSNIIRYCQYVETQKVFGNIYEMLILQDFEALTLCRTVEIIVGGGIIVLLIKIISSLYNYILFLWTFIQNLEPRFNERFIINF
ncbi:unnamed protein product [Paramecium octaurelia]|uniref:Transmembrane protein n=1 Tax=Paramecium octaurelia TaxID=43137 RepID=A0A8S1V0J5_PAROT|nr:unnamed protein product [Paramecium octaurelia]